MSFGSDWRSSGIGIADLRRRAAGKLPAMHVLQPKPPINPPFDLRNRPRLDTTRLASGSLDTKTLGAFSLDTVASELGTDRKTLLLVGVLGIVGGYLLHTAMQSASRGLKRGARRARKATAGIATPRNLAILAGTGIALGAAYWYYSRHAATATTATAAPHKPVPLPKLVNGHWQRPAQ